MSLPGWPEDQVPAVEQTEVSGEETSRDKRRRRRSRHGRRRHQATETDGQTREAPAGTAPVDMTTMGWYIPAIVLSAGDGTYIIKPGRPIQRGNAEQVARATGVHRKVLHRLADIGLLSRERPTPFTSVFYFAEVENLLERTKTEPNFWDEIKREAYLSGKSLRESGAK